MPSSRLKEKPEKSVKAKASESSKSRQKIQKRKRTTHDDAEDGSDDNNPRPPNTRMRIQPTIFHSDDDSGLSSDKPAQTDAVEDEDDTMEGGDGQDPEPDEDDEDLVGEDDDGGQAGLPDFRRHRRQPTGRRDRRKRPQREPWLDVFHFRGRWVARALDPYLDVSAIVHCFQQIDTQKPSSTDALHRKRYSDLLELVPELQEYMPKPGDPLDDFGDLWLAVREVQNGMNRAREADTNGIRKSLPGWIAVNPKSDVINPPLPGTTPQERGAWGMIHPFTRNLLCPQELRDPVLIDDSAYDIFASEGFAMLADDYPSLAYDQEVADPDGADCELGLFRGYYPLRVARYIFTGPSSVLTGARDRSVKRPNGEKHNMKRVSPRHIAYAMCQARYAISTATHWSEQDGVFNYHDFFDHIVNQFGDDLEEPWVKKTLDWWNVGLFGSAEGRDGAINREPTAIIKNPKSTAAKALAQRLARAAAPKPADPAVPAIFQRGRPSSTPSNADLSNSRPSDPGPSNAGSSNAEPSNAGSSNAEPSDPGPSNAGSTKTRSQTRSSNRGSKTSSSTAKK